MALPAQLALLALLVLQAQRVLLVLLSGAAVLVSAVGAAGALIEPVQVDDLAHMVTWIDDWHRLRIWQPTTLGLLVHVPGHWIRQYLD